MRRGDLVTIALTGDFGKPRPALIVQSDLFSEYALVTVLPITSDLKHARFVRIPIEPTAKNGLRQASNIMVDQIQTVWRKKSAR